MIHFGNPEFTDIQYSGITRYMSVYQKRKNSG